MTDSGPRYVVTTVVVLLVTASVFPGVAGLAETAATPIAATEDRASITAAAGDHGPSETGSGENRTAGADAAVVFGVQWATHDASLRRERFERELAHAETDEERAAVVAAYLAASRTRLDGLETRRDALLAARENGSLDAAAYRARATPLAARAGGLERFAADLEAAAEPLPAAVRREKGITESEIRRFRNRSRDVARTVDVPTADGGAGLYEDVGTLVDEYNAAASEKSGVLEDQLRNERVNFHVVREDRPDAVVSFTFADGRITEVRAGERGNATIRMRTDRATIRTLATADDPRAEFVDAVRDDRIEIVGLGPVNRIKWFLIGLAADLL